MSCPRGRSRRRSSTSLCDPPRRQKAATPRPTQLLSAGEKNRLTKGSQCSVTIPASSVAHRFANGRCEGRTMKLFAHGPARRILVATLAVVPLLAIAVGISIWRYEHAIARKDAALAARAQATQAAQSESEFWQEREAMDEYLLTREWACSGAGQRAEPDIRLDGERSEGASGRGGHADRAGSVCKRLLRRRLPPGSRLRENDGTQRERGAFAA